MFLPNFEKLVRSRIQSLTSFFAYPSLSRERNYTNMTE